MPWHPYPETKPPKTGPYLVHVPTGDPDSPLIWCAWYEPAADSFSLRPAKFADAITHWMELPDPPTAPGG